ncbi:MAG: reverse transcriptase domain-containing protein [Candidatus Thiodiazotropha endolucinida]|nr:endonuclease/exonuclease/phosphatase family protein [Candidatus Thiodiazotropha taylori]MCW4264995.1 reverse transcriptase domain-containing protein [Candidatus Thiodiazotropha endolucinida]
MLQALDIEKNPGPANSNSANAELSILHLNIRSIRNKIDYIKDHFLDFDILCFTETHLDHQITNDTLLLSDTFNEPYRRDRTNHGGGLLVYINSQLNHSRRTDLEIYCPESIWVEIKVNNINYLLGLFYSPRTADVTFFENLNLNIEKAYDLTRNLIILGDLNEDLFNDNYQNLKELILLNSLQNTVTVATRQSALLDPIIIFDDMQFLDSGTIDTPSDISDHKATYIRLPFYYQCQTTYKRLIWLYKRADYIKLKELIRNYDWRILLEGSFNDACVNFTNTFLNFAKICIPSKIVTIRPGDKPWFDSVIRRNMRIRDRLKIKSIKTGNSNDVNKYKRIRNRVNNLIKHAKEKFYNTLEVSISDFHHNDKRKFWQVIRHFVKNNKSSNNIPPLVIENENGPNLCCYTDDEKAECLNEYFSSISTINDIGVQLPNFELKTRNSLSNIACTASEISNLITLLNPNKATGPDSISNRMLKAVAIEISVPLELLFNRSFREGVFGDIWKGSHVLPLPKKGDLTKVTNYRPVSLLSGIGKLLERIVHKNIYNFLHENNLLYKYQSGFLPNHSTTYQLVDIYQHICQTFENNQFSCMIFCDVSKAFDRVWHQGLIFKLKQHGINGQLLNWIKDYLSNRSQKVILKSSTSTARSTNAGVPQGSVLGPLLFLVYVNDIADSLLSLTRLFADDSSLFYSASSLDDIQGIINHDLRILSAWSKQWLVTFNSLKTEAVLFTLKKFEHHPDIVFDGAPIKFVPEHKHLGLTLSCNGQWKKHIENIISSAAKVVGIMRKLKYTFNRLALNQIYLSYVLPIIEYSCIVWDGCTAQDCQSLEKLQHEAARIVTGLTRSVSLDKLYKECGWLTLKQRRYKYKLSFMYNVVHENVPSYILDIIPPLVRDTTQYPLRNDNNIMIPRTRTEIYRRSCIPSSISIWNSVDYNIREAPSLNSFKYQLKNHHFSNTYVPPHFIEGERYFSVLHARLRNGCSNLKRDLFNNHLANCPNCNCSEVIEDAEHFFFACSNFTRERVHFFHSTRTFHPLNLNKVLFGDDSLSAQDNGLLFKAVQTYIKNTGRFTENA